MLLFFHKGLQDGTPVLVTGTFSRPLDTDVYVSVVFEEDDNLSDFSLLRLQCLAGRNLVCQHEWTLDQGFTSYHLWFDLGRITNLREYDKVILTAEAYLDESPVLQHHAFVVTGSYNPVAK